MIKKNISRKMLSISLKFDISNISKGINSGSIPRADTVLLIAEYLEVDARNLVFGDENEDDEASEVEK